MKQQGHCASRTQYVIRKQLILLVKAYLLGIILSWLGWSKAKLAHKYYKTLSFTFWAWFFSTATHF